MAVSIKTFSIEPNVDELLSAVAGRFGLSKSKIVNELLRRSLPELSKSQGFEFSALEVKKS